MRAFPPQRQLSMSVNDFLGLCLCSEVKLVTFLINLEFFYPQIGQMYFHGTRVTDVHASFIFS